MFDVSSLATISQDATDAAKASWIAGLDARIASEIAGGGRGTALAQLETARSRAKGRGKNPVSILAFRGMASVALDGVEYATSKRSKHAMCNVYSFAKLESLSEALMRGSFPMMNGGDDATNAATIMTICEGRGTDRFLEIMTAVRRYQGVANLNPRYADMWAEGKIYTFGASTQFGSSLRALHGMGFIEANGKIRADSAPYFAILVEAAYDALRANMPHDGTSFPIRNTATFREAPADWLSVAPAPDAAPIKDAAPAPVASVPDVPAMSDEDAALLATLVEAPAADAAPAPAKAKRASKPRAKKASAV